MSNEIMPGGNIDGMRVKSVDDVRRLVTDIHGVLSKEPKHPIAIDVDVAGSYGSDRAMRSQVNDVAHSAAKLFDAALSEVQASPARSLMKLHAVGMVADGQAVKHEDVLGVAAVWRNEYKGEVIEVGRTIAANGNLSAVAQEKILNLEPYCSDMETMKLLSKNPSLNAETCESLLVRFAEDRYFVANLAEHAGKMGALSVESSNPRMSNEWSDLSLRIYKAEFNRECSVNALLGVRDQGVLMEAALDVASNVAALMKADKLRAVVRNPSTPVEALEVISKNVSSFMMDKHVKDQIAEAVKTNNQDLQLRGSNDMSMG